jgi:tetratricopeptide (TPR) repeat protein
MVAFMAISARSFSQYDSAYHYQWLDTDKAILFADTALVQAKSATQQANAYYMLGYLQHITKDYRASIEAYQKAIELYRKLDPQWFMYLHVNQGINYESICSYEVANHYYDKAIDLASILSYDDQLAKAQQRKARLYRIFEKYDSAIILNFAALEFYDAANNDECQAAILNEIGLSLLEVDSAGRSLEYFYAAAKAVDTTSNNVVCTACIQYNVGRAFLRLGDSAQAIDNFNKASKMFLTAPPEQDYTTLLVEMAPLVGNGKEQYVKAIAYAEEFGFTNTPSYLAALANMAKITPDQYLAKFVAVTSGMIAEKDSALLQYKELYGHELYGRLENTALLTAKTRQLKLWQWAGFLILVIIMTGAAYLCRSKLWAGRTNREPSEKKLI